jgi:enoyl-CoA hydratase
VTLLLVLDDAVPGAAPVPVAAAPVPVPVPAVPLVEPPPAVVPLFLGTDAVPVLITAPTPVVEVVWLFGTELIAVVPVVSPPVPLTVPAVAAPPPPPPLPVDVAALVVVVMAFAGGKLGLVLVSVPLGVVAAPGVGAVFDVLPGVSVGSVTKPEPTWPAPDEPGVASPTGSFVVAACPAAGTGAASSSNATATPAFRHNTREARVPDRGWRRSAASATVFWRRKELAIMATILDKASASTIPVVTIADGRATIRLNRPREHNRLEPDDLAVLRETFTRIDHDASVRVLMLTGTGKSFSSGYHIGALLERKAGKPVAENDDSFENVVNRLEALRIPTIAALQGSVYGGATDLALACDFRIGVKGMRMLMPAARLGIIYYRSGIERYVNRLGVAAAKKLFMLAEPIDAQEMHRIGYLDQIVPAEELGARVDALAATLAANAPLALAGLKRAINETAAGRLDHEALASARAHSSASEDHAEALKAWSEKRKPVFKGQ